MILLNALTPLPPFLQAHSTVDAVIGDTPLILQLLMHQSFIPDSNGGLHSRLAPCVLHGMWEGQDALVDSPHGVTGCFNKVFKCVEALAHRCFTPTTHPGLHFIGCDRESILTVQDVKHVIQLMIIHTPGMNDGVRSVPNLYYGWWSSDASKLHGHEIRDLVMHRLVPCDYWEQGK